MCVDNQNKRISTTCQNVLRRRRLWKDWRKGCDEILLSHPIVLYIMNITSNERKRSDLHFRRLFAQ